MYKVYEITDITKPQKYVGITKETIKRRLQNHRSNKRNGRYCSSSILDLDNCEISILEDNIKEENKREREQYWIDKIDCVNKINSVFNKEEYHKNYREEHKEEIKEYHKNYYEENKDELKERMKQYDKEHKEDKKEYNKNLYYYQKSWGEPITRLKRDTPNNLLLIDVNLFD